MGLLSDSGAVTNLTPSGGADAPKPAASTPLAARRRDAPVDAARIGIGLQRAILYRQRLGLAVGQREPAGCRPTAGAEHAQLDVLPVDVLGALRHGDMRDHRVAA